MLSGFNGNKVKHISEMKVGIKLCASLFSVVTLPDFSRNGQGHLLRHTARGVRHLSSVPFCFSLRTAFREAETGLRSVAGTAKILHPCPTKFNQVYSSQTAPIYRSVMLGSSVWKRQEVSSDNMGRHAVRCLSTMSNMCSISEGPSQVC
jgi:hypothetical protein